jgi:glycosyltransferase involved in cell wall biosynthesis
MTLAILIPTIARPSLTIAMQSYLEQMLPGDELIVVSDGAPDAEPLFQEAAKSIKHGITTYDLMAKKGHSGAFAIDRGLELATADAVLFCGDDDCAEPGALAAIRERLTAWGDDHRVHIFRYRQGITKNDGGPGWESDSRDPSSGQQFVAPLELARAVKYAADLGSMNDRVYMLAVIAASRKVHVSEPDVICWVDGSEDQLVARTSQNS